MTNLDAIFAPASVAVVGASATPGKVGHDIFANILRSGYTGTLFPVNPTARSILSVKAYPSLGEVPDPVDLAILILPPLPAEKAVEEAAARGVKGIVVVSAGFREVGAEGARIEGRILARCREAGIRLVGPNCLGVINPHAGVRLNASFAARMPDFGPISFISQSGALCTAVLDFAAERRFGFSKFVSIGNKADVDELDLLRYFHADPQTEVILVYLEELRRPGAEFIREVKAITSGARPTPVLAIKSGRTSAGARAAASHTGSLAGAEAAYDAIFQQAGILRAESIEELFNFASAFTGRKVPRGNQVAIVTNAGGPGIVATDVTVSSGLELAVFQAETVEALRSHLPSTANVMNPVDVIGDAAQDRYEHALQAVIRDDGVDGALVILTPQSMTNALGTAEAVVRIARQTPKPILCCFMGVIDVSAGVEHLQAHGIPAYRFPEHAAQAFAALHRYSRWLNRQHLAHFDLVHDTGRAARLVSEALAAGKTALGGAEGGELLACYGFRALPARVAADREEAAGFAASVGFPVALKIASPQILHKTDIGGVLLGVEGADEVRRGFDEIVARARAHDPAAVIEGVLVQKMAPAGEEVILGGHRDPVLGPMVMFGLGGIYVEVFKDVVFRMAPIERNEARRMARQIRGYALFEGPRGRPRSDVEAIERAAVSLSALLAAHPEVRELDINPLLVHEEGKGATVADCRILLAPPAGGPPARP